jgi:AmiR/NasT family two-component response regulator
VVAVAGNGSELVDLVRQTRPDLVITDIKMPELDGIAAAEKIFQEFPVSVILVSAYHDRAFIERARQDHVMNYLIKPIKQATLETAIAISVARFKEMQRLREGNGAPEA